MEHIISIIGAGFLSFFIGILLAPFFIRFLVAHEMWRKKVRERGLGGGDLPVFQKFHGEGEVHTPRFGGVLVVFVALAAIVFSQFSLGALQEILLPMITLFAAFLVGFVDDFLQVVQGKWAKLGTHFAGGLALKYRFAFVALLAVLIAWLFLALGGSSVLSIPFVGDFDIGWLVLVLFAIVMLGTYSGGVIDGIDGLAGGVFATIFFAFGFIAFFQGQTELAIFCAAIVGALCAFLWFNIPPAKFYMGEAGVMGLTVALAVVALFTNTIFLIPVIGILLVLESGSVLLQVLSKKLRNGKKIFIAAPFHHHLEAKGWLKEQITMRFWLIGTLAAIAGLAVWFVDKK